MMVDPIRQMLAAKTIAIVGLSDDPSRTSHQIGRYLRDQGFAITPVNPNCGEVFGIAAVKSVGELKTSPDVVLVFRRAEFCEAIAKDAVAIGTHGLWLQSGISSPGARRVAEAAGIAYVENRCIYLEHLRK